MDKDDLKQMINELDLGSSTKSQGRYVTQIIHFVDGSKRTIHGIDTHSIRQGQMTKFKLKDGTYVMINDEKVLMIEVFKEEQNV
tara:strand:+ start:207 stop:458 length:252 start_codon:yes stop_codon:yes gene_type:complete